MECKSDRRPIKESDLVSEQPGFFILFVGLIFAFIVGLSVRTAAQSNWFRDRLTEAIANVGDDWRIQHGNVGLYFKDGIRPTVGLYAEDVKIASDSSCYMKSGGFAHRVKIPLSLVKYILDGQMVSEVEIQDFKVEITERTPVCNSVASHENVGVPSELKRKNQISIIDNVERNSLRNEIERIRINKLEIFYPDEKYDYFLLRDITIENRSAHPKILFMEGNVDISAFVKAGDGQRLANLKVEYNEFPEKVIKTNLLGSLREGFFSVQLVNRIDDKKFQMQTELKNVSLSILKNFSKDFPKEISLKSNWISLKAYAEGVSDQVNTAVAEIKDVLINGDLGEFLIGEIRFPKGFYIPPDPFEIRLESADLSSLIKLIPNMQIPDQIDNLGKFNGQVLVTNNSNISLEGKLVGLGIVFSAEGIRKVERINVGKMSGALKKNKFVFETQDMQNENGEINGFLRLKSDDLKMFELESVLNEFQLSPSISDLLTGANTPLIFDELTLKARSGKEKVDYKASGKLKVLAHQYFEMSNVNFTVSGGTGKNQEIDVKADRWQNTKRMEQGLTNWGVSIPESAFKPRIRVTQSAVGMVVKLESQNAIRAGLTMDKDSGVDGFIATKDQEWKLHGTRDNFKIDKK